jgi:signal transduction histidine kinase/CheY-like chemotaxis protein
MITPLVFAFFEYINYKQLKKPGIIVCCIGTASIAATIFLPMKQVEFLFLICGQIVFLIETVFWYGHEVLYTFFGRIIQLHKKDKSRKWGALMKESITSTIIGNLLPGASVIAIAVVFDCLDSLFFHSAFVAVRFGFLVFILSGGFILARKLGELYRQVNEVNAGLEATVQARTAELEHQTELALSASRAKSSFLARMSHEIRTPMNAIIGIGELAMRETLTPRLAEYITLIKQSSNNLLSIINDVLDVSKIESGKLDIIPTEYSLSSLLNDCISIIRVHLHDSSILFAAKIDSRLPDHLFGDHTRIRQILINLMNNAVKYTREGSVVFSVTKANTGAIVKRPGGTFDPSAEKHICLRFDVADKGIGIKPEEMNTIFGEFVQLDVFANRGIEGSGLGLAIAKKLCDLMDGEIKVASKYGQGSVFTVTIPQEVHSGIVPLASLEDGVRPNVIVYDTRWEYTDSLLYTINSLGASCSGISNNAQLVDALDGGPGFIFTSAELLPQVKSAIERKDIGNIKIVLITRFGEIVPNNTVMVLPMPAMPEMVANILNGKSMPEDFSRPRKTGPHFIAPDACALIVDDVTTNLTVAEGLLAAYKIKTDCCLSGEKAIDLIKHNPYDIVFMDHMMPGMDGIEATEKIRSLPDDYFKTIPIVALTANAVSGMKEMFLENGMNDFLSKPIATRRLDEILARWLPREKQIKHNEDDSANAAVSENILSNNRDVIKPTLSPLLESLELIPGFNTASGLQLTGGTEKVYREILETFEKDIRQRLPLVSAAPDAAGMKTWTTHVHAVKGAGASVGAQGLSTEAAKMEALGKAGDIPAIVEKLPAFLDCYSAMLAGLTAALQNSAAAEAASAGVDQSAALWDVLRDALAAEDIGKIDKALNNLDAASSGAPWRALAAEARDAVLVSDFAAARELLSRHPAPTTAKHV